nr:hypothetical protein [Tanacetum cinerariifolium]
LPDALRICLDLSLFLRSLLLLGVPDSECCEASSKLRRAFTSLIFSCYTFSWCTFSAMIVKVDGSSCRSTRRAASEAGLPKSSEVCSFPSVFRTVDVGWLREVCSLVLMISILGNAFVFAGLTDGANLLVQNA